MADLQHELADRGPPVSIQDRHGHRWGARIEGCPCGGETRSDRERPHAGDGGPEEQLAGIFPRPWQKI